ncbi:chemotaxis protein CheD [Bdellovibrio sp. HCB2-146]|uniref:chemotaxis protein CheD n=1 Tax=Bdellovibrio sp. HCB2-146 TaxID=3394362 RepID=UPI0039BD30AC
MNQIEHHVRIGQIKTADAGEVLKTVLGSCVGIALIWRRHGKFALAHCLLPEPLAAERTQEARYVTQAIPRMLEILGVSKEDISELEAIVAGGGQMMDVEKPYVKYIVGTENLRVAKQILETLKIKIIAFEPGGEQGTKMRLDTSTGDFTVERIPRAA